MPTACGGTEVLDRLLIANRGEIAVRIARTASRLGIDTVAVYSDADRDAPHVDAAGLAVALGGLSPGESYLRGEAVIEAALRTGCDSVHPGYGFLAENATFAREVIDAGLVWVGPTPEQMTLLGDKLAAKRTALAAGVPTAAGIEVGDGEVADAAGLRYPVLVKAAAGGGGRGMRLVTDEAALGQAIDAARREAASAFGDGTVFVEPFVQRARHVEVQIIGDRHGTIVHLGERECSIQRRSQKLIEEAPSPGIDDNTRRRLQHAAVALATHVGYENAGTVEFLVGERSNDAPGIHFLEVNTRLQVEHPVTEVTTGLDIVELQLGVASGERLGLTQADVVVRGHAIEARVVAEDPAAGWLPSTGLVHRLVPGAGVRVDSGIADGVNVTIDYDSLLAKVIAHAPTREQAASRLARALANTELHGPTTNLAMLVNVLSEPSFGAGETFTDYLDEHPQVLAAPDERWPLHLVATVADAERRHREDDRLWGFAPSGWRNLPTQAQRTTWRRDGSAEPIVVEHSAAVDGSLTVRIEDVDHRVQRRHDDDSVVVEVDGIRCRFGIQRAGGATWTNGLGAQHRFEAVDRFGDQDAEAMLAGPVAPLPGTIVAVEVEAGAKVSAGDVLVVLEAMKMEHRITAQVDATVESVRATVGERVDAGQVLVTFSADGG